MLRHYETTIILHPELSDEAAQEMVAKTREVIQKHDGEVLHVENWGRRRMAYEIKKQQRGNYVILAYKAGTGVSRALDHFFRVTDEVLKSLTVRLEKGAVDALEARIAEIEKRAASAEAAAEATESAQAAAAEAAETAVDAGEESAPSGAASAEEQE